MQLRLYRKKCDNVLFIAAFILKFFTFLASLVICTFPNVAEIRRIVLGKSISCFPGFLLDKILNIGHFADEFEPANPKRLI